MDSTSFSGVITKEEAKGGWTYVVWPGSVEFLGTRKAAKVFIKVENHEFRVTCLPRGDGTHLLPLSKSVMTSLGRMAGDTIVIEVRRPQ